MNEEQKQKVGEGNFCCDQQIAKLFAVQEQKSANNEWKPAWKKSEEANNIARRKE